MQTVARAVEIRKPRRAEDHIEVLRHVEFQYGGCKIRDPRYLPKSPGESWILYLGSAILKLNVT